MRHLWCHESPPLEKATRELMSLLREKKVQDSDWLQKQAVFYFRSLECPHEYLKVMSFLAGRRMNYHLAHIWYIPSSMLTTCFTVAHWVWASAYPQIHESRLSIYGGSPGPQSLRTSLSLTMVEFSVKSFTLFMCWRVFEACSQICHLTDWLVFR